MSNELETLRAREAALVSRKAANAREAEDADRLFRTTRHEPVKTLAAYGGLRLEAERSKIAHALSDVRREIRAQAG